MHIEHQKPHLRNWFLPEDHYDVLLNINSFSGGSEYHSMTHSQQHTNQLSPDEPIPFSTDQSIVRYNHHLIALICVTGGYVGYANTFREHAPCWEISEVCGGIEITVTAQDEHEEIHLEWSSNPIERLLILAERLSTQNQMPSQKRIRRQCHWYTYRREVTDAYFASSGGEG